MGKLALGAFVLITSPLLVREPAWLGGVVLIVWFLAAVWWAWARRQAKRAALDSWRHGWFLGPDWVLIAEGTRLSWIPVASVQWVELTETGGSTAGWVNVQGPDGSDEGQVWSEGSESVPKGMVLRVQRGSDRFVSLTSGRVTSPNEQHRAKIWAMSRGLMKAEVLGRLGKGEFEGETPAGPLIEVPSGDLPDQLAKWLDKRRPLPVGVHLVAFGVPARPTAADYFGLLPASLVPFAFAGLLTWASLGHFDSLLVSMAGLVLAAGVVYFAAEAVWTILAGKIRGDALEAGRYRHGIFLCDQGLLLRWRRTATWLPIGCIQQFTESRSRMELDDMRRRGVSNTKDRWLALLWKSGAESGTAIYPCRLPLPVFERLRGWFRDRGIKRTPLQR